MSVFNKVAIAIAALMLAIIIWLFIQIKNYQHSACINSVKSESLSPDKSLVAVVFERQCGDSDSSIQVSILPVQSQLQQGAGNLLILNTGAQVNDVPMQWLSPTQLHIYYRLSGDEFKVEHAWQGVKTVLVSYAK